MLCSLAELGWDPDAPDEVALLHERTPGTSLDGLAPAEREVLVLSPAMGTGTSDCRWVAE